MAQVGIDCLGAALYPDEVLKALPKDAVIGFFWEEFGPARDFYLRCLRQGFRTFRIQALWDKTHAYPVSLVPRVLKIAQDVEAISNKFGATTYFSPFCEHNHPRDVMLDVFAKLRKVVNLPLVNSVWKGSFLKGEINEVHYDENGPEPEGDYILSGDGVGADNGAGLVDIDVEKWKARFPRAMIRLGWGLRCNLNELEQPFIPPKQRRAKPTIQYLKSVYRLMLDIGGKIAGLPKGWTWKTHSEDKYDLNAGKPNEDIRANKPVLIANIRDDKGAIVLAMNGKAIGKLGYLGQFTKPGFYRYYSGTASNLYGVEFAQKARRACGSELVKINVGGRIFGPIHPAFRNGDFR